MQIEQSEKINIIMKLSTVLKDVKNSRLIFFRYHTLFLYRGDHGNNRGVGFLIHEPMGK